MPEGPRTLTRGPSYDMLVNANQPTGGAYHFVGDEGKPP